MLCLHHTPVSTRSRCSSMASASLISVSLQLAKHCLKQRLTDRNFVRSSLRSGTSKSFGYVFENDTEKEYNPHTELVDTEASKERGGHSTIRVKNGLYDRTKNAAGQKDRCYQIWQRNRSLNLIRCRLVHLPRYS